MLIRVQNFFFEKQVYIDAFNTVLSTDISLLDLVTIINDYLLLWG